MFDFHFAYSCVQFHNMFCNKKNCYKSWLLKLHLCNNWTRILSYPPENPYEIIDLRSWFCGKYHFSFLCCNARAKWKFWSYLTFLIINNSKISKWLKWQNKILIRKINGNLSYDVMRMISFFKVQGVSHIRFCQNNRTDGIFLEQTRRTVWVIPSVKHCFN